MIIIHVRNSMCDSMCDSMDDDLMDDSMCSMSFANHNEGYFAMMADLVCSFLIGTYTGEQPGILGKC